MVACWLRVAARGSWCRVRVDVTPAGRHEGTERFFLSAARLGVSGVATRASDFRWDAGWPCGGASPDAAFPGAPASL